MGSQDLWPPLEEVREWAAGKIESGQTQPAVTGKYKSLIAVIDEILAVQQPRREDQAR